MKFLLLIVSLFCSSIVYSQDSLMRGVKSGKGDRGSTGHFNAEDLDKDILGARKVIYKNPVNDTCKEKARIVLRVVVNRKGSVVRALFWKGSTSASPCLIAAAREAAMKSGFEPDDNAPEEQRGRMSFYFKGID